jgi:short-subunit dehydrogenase
MASMLDGKTYWLIGASAGIGAALARELDARGATLVLSARSRTGLAEVAATLSRPARILPFDVTDAAALPAEAPDPDEIDGLIYMAGDYQPMTARTWDAARAHRISAINYTGALDLLGQMVPGFARRGRGHVVIIGSLAGYAGLPGAISYGASKAALMHLAQNLRVDLKGTGVHVQLVNPGFVDTRLTRMNDFRMPFITTPDKAARIIANHMERRRFSRSFPAGFSWILKLRAMAMLARL